MTCLVHTGNDVSLRSAHAALLDWIAPQAPPHLPLSFVAPRPDAAITDKDGRRTMFDYRPSSVFCSSYWDAKLRAQHY